MNMAEEQEVFLTPLENYLKVGLHIGTKFRTKYMAPFIYKVRPDGLAVLNVKKIDERIEIAARYRPGLLTNPALEDFKEIKILFVTDPWPDKNAVMDAVRTGIPVVACCDTNNESNYVDLVVPCNNKGKKSLGLMFYLLGKEYMKARGTIKSEEELSIPLEEFIKED